MKSKWSNSHSHGTVLNNPMVSPPEKKTPLALLSLNNNTSASGSLGGLGGSGGIGGIGGGIGSASGEHESDYFYIEDSETSRLNDDYDNDDDKDNYYGYFGCNWKLYKGILFSSMSSVFFSLCSVIVKYLNTIHPGELAVFRFIGILLLTLPLVYKQGTNPFGPPELRHFLVLRGIAGATSLFLRFCAFRYLPIADASVIIFSVPVFVSIFAKIFLKEPCGVFQTCTVFLTMVGLLLTTKLPFIFGSDGDININSQFVNSSTSAILLNQTLITSLNTTTLSEKDIASRQKLYHLYGVLCAMASTGFAASVFIFIRKAKVVHHSIIMFNFGWVAIIETTIITALLDQFSLPTDLFQWTLIILLGVFSFCGQMLLTRSLQLEQAGPVSVVRAATDIALAFIWQLWLFHDVPDIWSISGAFLVTTCIIMTSLRKWIISLPDHSRIKSKLFFLIS